LRRYVNVVLTLITLAGDHVADEVWHRVLQIIVNREDVQSHAARVTFQVSDVTLKSLIMPILRMLTTPF
jgi:hypothetical protein